MYAYICLSRSVLLFHALNVSTVAPKIQSQTSKVLPRTPPKASKTGAPFDRSTSQGLMQWDIRIATMLI